MTNEDIERLFMEYPAAFTTLTIAKAPLVVRDDAGRHVDSPAYTQEQADAKASCLREVDPQARPRVIQRRGETP